MLPGDFNARAKVLRQGLDRPGGRRNFHSIALANKAGQFLSQRAARDAHLPGNFGHFGRERHQLAAQAFRQAS